MYFQFLQNLVLRAHAHLVLSAVREVLLQDDYN